jgi:hypothetical protein
MKKLIIISTFLILITPLISIKSLNAILLTDINGVYTDLGEEGDVTGAGISLLWDMPRYFDEGKVFFYLNSTFAFSTENRDKPAETVRTYYPLSAGFEYRHQLTKQPLYVTGSAGAGASYFRKEGPVYSSGFMDPSKTRIDSAFGPYADVMFGINYVLSQNAAVSIKAGYQVSFYNEDIIDSPSGMQFTAGVRVPISESHMTLGGVDSVYKSSELTHNYVMDFPRKKSTRSKTFCGFYPGVIVPFGKFREISDIGYGGVLSISRTNLFFRNFEGGVSPGFYYMHENDKDYKRMLIAPLYLTAGYRIGIGNSFLIKPLISAGGAYVDAKYLDRTKILSEQDSHLMTFEPTAKGGLFSEYILINSLTLSLGCEYGAIIEKNGILHFAAAHAGINYSF